MTNTRLLDLEDQVIELTIHFGRSHVTVAGRVHFVATTPAVWVAEACLDPDLTVREDEREPGKWSASLRKQVEYV